jgi:catechol 2,3-dioxygenase-like lactoylglutathione lyase family enzyme
MTLIPTLRCRNMRQSLAFYTGILDFERVDGDDDVNDPSFSVLARDGSHLFLSSHGGDGAFGSVVAVTTNASTLYFERFARGDFRRLAIPTRRNTCMRARSTKRGGRASSTSRIPMATRSAFSSNAAYVDNLFGVASDDGRLRCAKLASNER